MLLVIVSNFKIDRLNSHDKVVMHYDEVVTKGTSDADGRTLKGVL